MSSPPPSQSRARSFPCLSSQMTGLPYNPLSILQSKHRYHDKPLYWLTCFNASHVLPTHPLKAPSSKAQWYPSQVCPVVITTIPTFAIWFLMGLRGALWIKQVSNRTGTASSVYHRIPQKAIQSTGFKNMRFFSYVSTFRCRRQNSPSLPWKTNKKCKESVLMQSPPISSSP